MGDSGTPYAPAARFNIALVPTGSLDSSFVAQHSQAGFQRQDVHPASEAPTFLASIIFRDKLSHKLFDVEGIFAI